MSISTRQPRAEASRRAFRVRCDALDAEGIYAATSAARAVYQAYQSAREAGYDLDFADFKVRRAPGYDSWAAGWAHRHGLVEDAIDLGAAAGGKGDPR